MHFNWYITLVYRIYFRSQLNITFSITSSAIKIYSQEKAIIIIFIIIFCN